MAAALEPARWTEALQRLAVATGSDYAQLIGFGPDYGANFNWVSGAGADMIAAFDALGPADSFRVHAARRFPDLPIIDERHYDAVAPLASSSDYLDLCRHWGIPFGCQTDLRNRPDGIIGLALLRSEHNGRTRAADRALFDRARIDVAAAIALQIALEEEGYRLIAGTFEAMASACFVLDRSLRVRALTPAAEQLLSHGLLRLRDQYLTAPVAAGGDRLRHALAGLREDDARARSVLLLCDRPGGESVLNVQMHLLPRREWDMGFSPHAVVTVTQSSQARLLDPASLQDAFGLTLAEAEIARMIAGGADRAAVCAARRISQETLRSHLRAIFAKVGVRREVDLVHLLGRLSG